MTKIQEFPKEIKDKMMEEQSRQGNLRDWSVFEKSLTEDKRNGGFLWKETEDGHLFWADIILGGEFDRFFEKYPRI